jgi:hypothetical protein
MQTGQNPLDTARRRPYPHRDQIWIAYATLALAGAGIVILGAYQ